MTQFTEIQVGGAVLQTSSQCTRILPTLTLQHNMVACWSKNVLHWFLLTGLQMGTLVTFTAFLQLNDLI